MVPSLKCAAVCHAGNFPGLELPIKSMPLRASRLLMDSRYSSITYQVRLSALRMNLSSTAVLLKVRGLLHREVKFLAQGHTVGK